MSQKCEISPNVKCHKKIMLPNVKFHKYKMSKDMKGTNLEMSHKLSVSKYYPSQNMKCQQTLFNTFEHCIPKFRFFFKDKTRNNTVWP